MARFKGNDILPSGPEQSNQFRYLDDVATRHESTVASFKLAVMESEFTSLNLALRSHFAAREDDIINPEQAKELFNVDTDKDISAAKAAMIQAHQEHKAELRKVIDYGPQGFMQTATNFMAGLGGAMLDPIGIVIGMGASKLAAVGMGKLYANTVKGAGILGKSSNVVAKQLAKQSIGKMNLATDLIGNVAGNVAAEGLIIAPSREAELEEYNAFNAFAFAVATGVGFPLAVRGLHKGLGAAGDLFDRAFELKEGPLGRAYDYVEAKMGKGKLPIVDENELRLFELEDIEHSRMATPDEIDNVRNGLEEKSTVAKIVEDNLNSEESNLYYRSELNSKKQEVDLAQEQLDPEGIIMRNLDEADEVNFEADKAELDRIESSVLANKDSLTKAFAGCIAGVF